MFALTQYALNFIISLLEYLTTLYHGLPLFSVE